MDFKILVKSDYAAEEIPYDLFIKEWTEDFMILKCNFSYPTLISSGFDFDVAQLKVKNRFLFTSASTGKQIKDQDTNGRAEFPRQVLTGVNITTLEEQA